MPTVCLASTCHPPCHHPPSHTGTHTHTRHPAPFISFYSISFLRSSSFRSPVVRFWFDSFVSIMENDTTRFLLAFLIIWLVLSTALLVMAFLGKLALPPILTPYVKGNKYATYGWIFLQFCVWVFLLAALAADQWSKMANTGPWPTIYAGVTGTHTSDGGLYTEYDCSNQGDSCRTPKAAGAFTLIFGLICILFVSTPLTMHAIISAANISIPSLEKILAKIKQFSTQLWNAQWICLQAMVFLWSVCVQGMSDELSNPNFYELGASWALAFVALILALALAMVFGDGMTTNATAPAGGSSTTTTTTTTTKTSSVHTTASVQNV